MVPSSAAGADGVVQQVPERPGERIGIADHHRLPGVGDRDGRGRAGAGLGDQRLAHLREVDGLGPQRLVGLEAREVEQVVHEPAQPLGAARELGLELVAPRPRRLLAQERLGGRLQRRDRRAQLVRGVGQEAPHRRLRSRGRGHRLLQGVDHGVKRRRHPAQLGVAAPRAQPQAAVPGGDPLCHRPDMAQRPQSRSRRQQRQHRCRGQHGRGRDQLGDDEPVDRAVHVGLAGGQRRGGRPVDRAGLAR